MLDAPMSHFHFEIDTALCFRKATESHVAYMRKAGVGQGCDRHLMGLSMLVEESEEAPALFSHPLHMGQVLSIVSAWFNMDMNDLIRGDLGHLEQDDQPRSISNDTSLIIDATERIENIFSVCSERY
jgi:hypothetical protein